MGGLTLLAPLTLIGLIALPIVWWILKISPPRPRREIFPPLRILADVETDEQTPDATPLWLLLFRLALVALAVFALAKPLIKSAEPTRSDLLTLVIDRSVTATPIWGEMMDEAEAILRQARRDNRDVRLVLSGEDALDIAPASEALTRLKTVQPDAYPNKIEMPDDISGEVVTISSGLQPLDSLRLSGSSVYAPAFNPLLISAGVRETAQGFEADYYRVDTSAPGNATIEARSGDGRVLSASEISFAPGANLTTAKFDLPTQLRRKVTRLSVAGQRSAASVYLLDDNFGRPLVGVLSPPADTASPLLSEPFYAKQALLPYADVFEGDLEDLLELQPAILVMPDSMRDDGEAVQKYVSEGGVLLRFAGPRLAKRPDSLLPVRLREGGRDLGGALAWEDPQKLASFSEDSPFFGLNVPESVTVKKQVMAEPGLETDNRTWARLEDGSPIVTSRTEGDGRIILIHVTAGPEWSNLALDGLYVDMLRRILPLARGRSPVAVQSGADWVLDRALSPFGAMAAPPPVLPVIQDTAFETITASADTPPGYYRQGTRRRALQSITDPSAIKPISVARGVDVKSYGGSEPQSLAGWLLGLAAAWLALDALAALLASGRIHRLMPGRGMATILLAACLIIPSISEAQQAPDDIAVQAALGLHLAYIETGNGRRDALSRTALESLKTQLTARTTIEPVGVHGVQPDQKGLEMYPFLYWSVGRDAPALSPESARALNAYMSSGGTIVFDTYDEGDRALRAGAPHPGLARVTESLDIPRLQAVPEDHVMTKSFYLLQIYPGRWANGPVYVEAGRDNSGTRDGVSPVIIGSNDWAAGWAIDPDSGPLIELNSDIPRQREMSARFGVNLAMYALSGNYKADQVHAAALVERLGKNGAPKLEVEE